MESLIEMAKRATYFTEMELQVLLESYDEEKDRKLDVKSMILNI